MVKTLGSKSQTIQGGVGKRLLIFGRKKKKGKDTRAGPASHP